MSDPIEIRVVTGESLNLEFLGWTVNGADITELPEETTEEEQRE